MTPSTHSPKNLAVIATAGSGKTSYIVEQALGHPSERVLVTTYTNENLSLLQHLLVNPDGTRPTNISTIGWLTLLMNEGARPYQHAVLDRVNSIRSLDFIGQRNRFTKRDDPWKFFLDAGRDIYRDGLSHFCCEANRLSGGRVIARLAAMYDRIYLDEVQDLVGYDLDFLDLLAASSIKVTVVGDPRQHTYSTNNSPKNKKYRGPGLTSRFAERPKLWTVEERNTSHRCNQEICDFADSLFPSLPASMSKNHHTSGHDGIFAVKKSAVLAYVAERRPHVLRYNRTMNTLGLDAQNIGISKGATHDRILLFPTTTMVKFFITRDPAVLRAKDSLYVAVTRARFSVAIVVPD